jgi:tripartite-type tricarboxylate transporter receptor subunit TctC
MTLIHNPRRRAVLVSSLALAAAGARAQTADFPTKPITFVVPFAPGGSTDVTARRVAEEMQKTLRTSVVIENKPGAGSFVATSHVVKSAKDGYTLLFAGPGILSLNPHIFRNLPYKVTDLVPVSTVSKQAFVINGSPAIPVRTVAELVAFAKTKPDGLSIGTVGTGTTSHILAEWIARTLGIKAIFVPYKGTSQSTIDLISGRIDVQIDGISTAVAMHTTGKTRIVASMGAERSIIPDGVQTFVEAGYPQLVAYANFAVMAPAGTPDPVVRKLHAAIVAAVGVPALAEKLRANGELPDPSASPEDFAALVRSEFKRWGDIVKPMNLSLD